MADPRIVTPLARQSKLSPLREAQASSGGEVVNACQFDCDTEQLDPNGYCRHLVGFYQKDSRNGAKKCFSPRMMRVAADGRPISEFVPDSAPQPLHAKDILVRITGTDRVYRDVDKYPPEWANWVGSFNEDLVEA